MTGRVWTALSAPGGGSKPGAQRRATSLSQGKAEGGAGAMRDGKLTVCHGIMTSGKLTVCHGKWHKMAIEIGDLPIEHGDFPICDVSFVFFPEDI